MANLSDEQKERLRELAAFWRDSLATVTVHRRKLQDAVLQAIDVDNARPADVARALGVSPTRVYAIIAAAYQER